jgi:hypothetical protein
MLGPSPPTQMWTTCCIGRNLSETLSSAKREGSGRPRGDGQKRTSLGRKSLQMATVTALLCHAEGCRQQITSHNNQEAFKIVAENPRMGGGINVSPLKAKVHWYLQDHLNGYVHQKGCVCLGGGAISKRFLRERGDMNYLHGLIQPRKRIGA